MTQPCRLRPRLSTVGPRVQVLGPQLAGNVTPRIRGRQLQRIREYHFRRHPLCVECEKEGVVRAATELDHIIALCNGGRDEEGNRQGLCWDHHAAKTVRDMAQAMGK
jgi:5-methylcytosine-specific restriction endonuclease McrA